jgi:mono/diheme cytochrome c family protein
MSSVSIAFSAALAAVALMKGSLLIMRKCRVLFIVIVLLLCTAGSLAQPPLETVQRTKQATAFVTVELADGIAEGSAFCIDASGLFVTNAHVVEDQKPGGRLLLVLHSGESDQVVLPANVVKLDKDKDLAILQIVHPKNLVALTLGNSNELVETMSVVAFGYPFGTDLALKDGDYPSISVSTGHITSLRKVDGALTLVQLDASLNEGNSGGPIIDSKGEVVAIVMAGIPGSGVNMAIPVSYLHSVVNSLSIVFTPPVAKAGHLHDDQDFRIELLSQGAAAKERAAVEITLSSKETGKRTIKMETSDGRIYMAQAPLLGERPTKIPDTITYQITATRAGMLIASEDGWIPLEDAMPAPKSYAFAYDGFDYPAGAPMNGLKGGTGDFMEPWHDFGSGYTDSIVTDRGLTFGNLKTTGNAIMTVSRPQIGHARPFQVSPGKVGGVLFISFLVRPLEATDSSHRDSYFIFDYGTIAVGCGSSDYYWLDNAPFGRSDKINSKAPVVIDETTFLVLRITLAHRMITTGWTSTSTPRLGARCLKFRTLQNRIATQGCRAILTFGALSDACLMNCALAIHLPRSRQRGSRRRFIIMRRMTLFRGVALFTAFCALLIAAGSRSASPAQLPDDLAQQAFDLLDRRCGQCHGETGSNKDLMLISRTGRDALVGKMSEGQKIPLVNTTKPEASLLYLRITGKHPGGVMPPSYASNPAPLTQAEQALILKWVQAGAPDWKNVKLARPERRNISNIEILKSIDHDLASLDPDRQKDTRYFTLTHLYNAGVSDTEIAAYRDGLKRLLNSLSWEGEIINPASISAHLPQGTGSMARKTCCWARTACSMCLQRTPTR